MFWQEITRNTPLGLLQTWTLEASHYAQPKAPTTTFDWLYIFQPISLDSQQSLATQSHGLSTWTAIVWSGPNQGGSYYGVLKYKNGPYYPILVLYKYIHACGVYMYICMWNIYVQIHTCIYIYLWTKKSINSTSTSTPLGSLITWSWEAWLGLGTKETSPWAPPRTRVLAGFRPDSFITAFVLFRPRRLLWSHRWSFVAPRAMDIYGPGTTGWSSRLQEIYRSF